MLNTALRDAVTGAGAVVDPSGILSVYSQPPPAQPLGRSSNRRILNGLIGTGGLDTGTTNLRVNGLVTNVDAYVQSELEADIHIMGIAFFINDTAVVANRFGNVTGLTLGFDMFVEQHGDTTYLLRQVLSGGQLTAQTGWARAFGNGTDVNVISNLTGTTDAQVAYLDIGAILPPEGLRIGRGTQDRLVVRIRDNLSQISANGGFTVRAFGFRKYP